MSKKKIKYVDAILSVSAFIIIITIGAFHFNGYLDISIPLATDKLGHFGDFIGGFLGTGLTIIATIYVYKTYHSQKKELKSQKKELKLQRELVAQQQFENTFFNMLNVHRELKYSLVSKNRDLVFENIKGIKVLSLISEEFRKYFNANTPIQTFAVQNIAINLSSYKVSQLEHINDRFEELFFKHQEVLSHYCRNVYHILKFIRVNEIKETIGNNYLKYKNYADIFQSQLNVDEQFLLFYNFIYFDKETDNEIFHTINLVNHYKFLENIGIDNLINKEHELFYDFVIKGSDRVI